MEVRKMMSEENLPSNFYKNQSAILLPPLEGVDFVLKLSLIRLASEKPFCGEYEENPVYHLQAFEDFIGCIKRNGVTEEWLSCKLFPYTLSRDSSKWLRKLPANSLTSWRDVRGAFLNHFYTEKMTEDVRRNIAGFKQHECETFREAWERFNEYIRSCPHHGFKEGDIIRMFFRGLAWIYMSALDSASGGNFFEQYPEDARKLIKKYARSTSANCLDTARSASLSGERAQFVAEVNEMREMITNVLLQKKKRSKVCVDEAERGYVKYLDDQRYQRRPYTSSQAQETPPFQPNNNIESMLQSLLHGQQKADTTIDTVYNELHARMMDMGTHIKQMDNQIAQNAESIRRQEGMLHGKTDTNPKYLSNVNTVNTRSGQRLKTATQSNKELEEAIELEEFDDEENAPESESADSPQQSTDWDPKPSKEKSPENESADCPEESTDWESKLSGETSSQMTVGRQPQLVDRLKACDAEIFENSTSPERVNTAVPPYPRKSKGTTKEIADASCKEMVEQLTVTLPFFDAYTMPSPLKQRELGLCLDDTVGSRLIPPKHDSHPCAILQPEHPNLISKPPISISAPLERSKLHLVVDEAFDYEDMVVPPELIEISMKETTHGSCYKHKAPNTTIQPLPQEMRSSPHELNSKPSYLVEYFEGVLSIVGWLALIFLAYFSMISRASFGVLDLPFPRAHPRAIIASSTISYLLDPAVTYAVYSKGPRPP